MDCQEALDLLYDIIDREASEIDAAQVQTHLNECRRCFEIYRLEESVQAFINEKMKQDVSLPKVDALKGRILGQLDMIDRNADVPNRTRPPFFRLATAVALAALLALVVIGAALLTGWFRQQPDHTYLREAHQRAATDIARFQNAAVTSRSLAKVCETMDCELCLTVNDFQLTGGLIDELSGIEVGHFVYQSGNRCISVFVAGADRLAVPDEARANPIKVGDITFYEYRCGECRLVYHRIGDVIVVTVASEPDIDLLRFVPASLPI